MPSCAHMLARLFVPVRVLNSPPYCTGISLNFLIVHDCWHNSLCQCACWTVHLIVLEFSYCARLFGTTLCASARAEWPILSLRNSTSASFQLYSTDVSFWGLCSTLKEPPLLSTPSFWEWVAPSTTFTRWSLLRSWALILKELRNLLPSFMSILSITLPNFSIPDVPFPALLSTHTRRRFQVKPATLLIPIDLFLFPLVEEFYGTRYQSGSFSLINVESFF